MVNMKETLKKFRRKVKNFTLNFGTQHPVVDSALREIKQKVIGLLEYIFIGALLLGFITFMLNNQTINYFTIFFLSFLLKIILFGSFILILILTLKLIINNLKNYEKSFIENLKKELISIFPLTITKKTFLFSLTCFLFSFVLMYFDIYKPAIPIFFLGIFFPLREIKPVQRWLNDINTQDLEITKRFREKYSKIYLFNKFCKVFCFIYFFLFIFFHLVDFSFLSTTDSLETGLSDIVKILEPLYLLFLVFLNSVFIDFFLELIVIFSDTNILLATLIRRASKIAVTTVAGGGIAGTLLSISPAVEFSGVNESQIWFGRGYGYRTSCDWAKGTLLNSYLDNSTMEYLAQKYGGTEKILDGDGFRDIMKNEEGIVKQLNKSVTPLEQRILGLRTF
jgi:hypothetical protein